MMYFTLIIASIIISFIFMNMKHPLAMGLTLLFQTLIIALITGLISQTFWYSYILFLVFLGGMLILFIYVTALASNEMFSLSMKLTTFSMFLLTMFYFMLMFIDMNSINLFFLNHDMHLSNLTNFNLENSLNLMKLYNFPTNSISLLLINYLFLTLIIIVKITTNIKGPLRKN